MMEEEVGVLLVITAVIGSILMLSLLICYICVFRELCCSSEERQRRPPDVYSADSTKRGYSAVGQESIQMNELHSQNTEIERV